MAKNSRKSSRTTGANVVPVGDVTGGVDTHLDFHVAAARDGLGRVLGTARFEATAAGYVALLAWLRGFGQPLVLVGVEGTGSYGTGLTRHLLAQGVAVVEVNRPNRQKRRRQGKSDPADAINAAAAAQSGEATAAPKGRTGPVESVRVLRETRGHWVKARTAAINTLKALLVTAPAELRESLQNLSTPALLAACTAFLTGGSTGGTVPEPPARGLRGQARVQAHAQLAQTLLDPTIAVRLALGELARTITGHDAQITRIDTCLTALIQLIAPRTSSTYGFGTDRAGQLLVTIGDHPDRIHSEAALAALTGVAPQDASSGKNQHHRLSRAGDRQANAALYGVIITRLVRHQPTRDYITQRLATTNKMTKKHLIRVLKRYLVREIYPLITADLADITNLQTA